jgi:cell division control protein 24
MRLRGLPAAEGCYLDPSYELPTFLIKPVQRICKYPLLLDQLLKKTAPEAPYYQELADGLQVIRRITDKVNETRRLQENIQLVRDLETRVEDWKGHSISTFGALLLSDVFMVSKSDTEREYHVYLFEKILLCCKEVLPNQPKKNSKSGSILKQKSQPAPTAPGKKPKTMLQLKGRIFINNVTAAHGSGKMNNGHHNLQVWWKGDIEQESFSLRCKNEEQLRQWQVAIGKLIDDFAHRRHHMAAHYGQNGGMQSPGMYNMAGAGANGRRSTAGSLAQQSVFPQTPLTDQPPFNMFTRADSQASHRVADDEHVEGMRDGMESGASSGRGTPMGGRYSQPAAERERQMSLSVDTRPRARTEDQDSHTMSQWRSNSPNIPPVPRNGSLSSSSEMQYSHTLPVQHGPSQQVRKSSSSKQMRQAYTSAHPRPSLRAMGSNESASSDTAIGQAEQMEHLYVSQNRPRVDSTSSRPTTALEAALLQQHNRSRSSSNPSAFAGLPTSASPQPPPLPRSNHAVYTNGVATSNEQATASRRTGIERKGSDNNDKRFSSSSISTDDSNRSSHSRPGSTAASSAMTLSTGALGGAKGYPMSAPRQNHSYPHSIQSTGVQPPAHQSSAVKLVIHHGEDKLVVVVLSTINLADLSEKVSKKIRLVSGRKGPIEHLRIRYIDEDGDKILMHDDEDVQMAFEMSRNLGSDVNLVVA